jgi:hypothetical protein
MDKVLSIASAILMSGMMLLVAWLGSTRDFEFGRKSLGPGLTVIGGPLGMTGGIVLVIAVGVAIYGLHEIANASVGRMIVRRLRRRGRPDGDIAAQLDTMPISRGLKERLKKGLNL